MPQLPRKTIVERAARLRAAGDAALARHLGRQIGRGVLALVERDGLARAEDFTEVAFSGPASPGQIVRLAVTGGRRQARDRWRAAMSAGPLTGGCQCGAVRFSVSGALGRPSICHCRMCQKAFASPYGALVSAPEGLVWTRGSPTYFQSSNRARRSFCAACGTPLTFEAEGDAVELAIVAFDQP